MNGSTIVRWSLILLSLVLLVVTSFFIWTQITQSLFTPSYDNSNEDFSIVFSANRSNATDGLPSLFTVNARSGDTENFIDYESRGFAEQTETSTFVIANVADTEDPDGWQPVVFTGSTNEPELLQHANGYNEQNFIVYLENGLRYAYDYQLSADVAESELLTDWYIALHDVTTDSVWYFASAARPTFINNGNDLLIMESDGIYRFNIATQALVPFVTTYYDLSWFDNYAVLQNETTIIMTVSSLNTISIHTINPEYKNEDLTVDKVYQPAATETSVFSANTQTYYDPVVGPDNGKYAVMMLDENNYDEGTGVYTTAVIEVRNLADNMLINTIEFDGVDAYSAQLHGLIQ